MEPTTTSDVCPKCNSPLAEISTTATGRKLQRCSKGTWNPTTKKNEGCDYVKWLEVQPEQIDEKCPKCGAPLVIAFTRFGKKMKKCTTGGWDKEARKATGCDFIEWMSGKSEELDEECPTCGKPLVLYTTAKGKKMKKCSTSGWDSAKREATGCTYVEWLKPGEYEKNGEENLPPEPEG
jgi:ssDNA-binding Zn-finger/Zn-ribbon topoisomerase 1